MELKVKYKPVDELAPYANNSRTHSEAQISQVAESIREFGFTNPVLIDEYGTIIAGHGRVMAAQLLGMERVPTIELSHLSERQRRAYVIADNRLALNAGWDFEKLSEELSALAEFDFDLSVIGFDEQELDALLKDDASILPDEWGGGGNGSGTSCEEDVRDTVAHGALAEKFLLPPFTVLNARDGWWQERKHAWLGLGIKSEIGRESAITLRGAADEDDFAGNVMNERGGGTSVFDPVLCELAYRWFSPVGGIVIDPFAGGSVRGVVASKLGRLYHGVELRGEQVAANQRQAEDICRTMLPRWIREDSRNILSVLGQVEADLLFSCPPYADLEKYSDDPADISTLAYDAFLEVYRDIIMKSCRLLKDDRFACFVVGEVRGKDGNYYNFVGDTIRAFMDAGLRLYNEAIMVTPAGSLPIRVGKQFTATRKLGKTHQNILVFVKGDARKATEACGNVDVADLFTEDNAE